MKLKSLLIIFLILGFFMAVTAVRPAAAFDAEVSIISAFDVETKTMRSTTDGTEGPLRDPNDHYFDSKAVLSSVNTKVRVDVSGYGRRMQYGDVEIEYLSGGEVVNPGGGADRYVSETEGLYNTSATISNLSSAGCDVQVKKIQQMSLVEWIKITVLDAEGTNPIFTWLKYVQDAEVPGPVATITPANLATYTNLVFSRSLYLTVKSDTTEPVYAWLLDSYDNLITSSEELSDSVALSVETGMMSDPNFVVRYTDARSFGETGADNEYWDGNYTEIRIEHAYYEDSLPGYLNPQTKYNIATNSYSILMPVYEDMSTTTLIPKLNNAIVYYDGKVLDTTAPVIDGGKPAYDPDNENNTYSTDNWITVPVADLPTVDTAKNWSFSNDKVVIMFDDTSDPYHPVKRVSTAADGVGPILLNAYVSHDYNNVLILKFSEELADTITLDDVIANLYTLKTQSFIEAELNPENAKELMLTAAREIKADQKVNLKLADGEMSITDTKYNPAYVLNNAIDVTEERIIEKVEVVDVDVENDRTIIKIEFDKSMKNKATVADSDASKKAFYRVELVPGLNKDTQNDGFALIDQALLGADEVTVTLTVSGAIASTAAENLPKVSIVQDASGNDMEGADAAPVRAADKAPRLPDDKVGPYLKAASFSYNPVMGKTVVDLIKEEKLTLSLFFSEKVENSSAIGSHTFDEAAGSWSNQCLLQAGNDLGEFDPNGVWRVVLTLKELYAKTQANLPYQSPGFSQAPAPAINILPTAINYILDEANNPASDVYPVIIADDTKLWATEAKTADKDNDGIVDKITVTFGKNVNIYAPKFSRDKKIIEINGDPNRVDTVTKTTSSIIVNLREQGGVNTAWMPQISFDLNATTTIPILGAATSDKDIKADFALTAKDGVAPILKLVNGKIEAVSDGNNAEETKFYVKVKLEFTEAMDPNIWDVPTALWRYVDEAADSVSTVIPKTFITSTSVPASSTLMGCGGNKIALYLQLNKPLTGPNSEIAKIKIYGPGASDELEYFDDLAGNAFPEALSLELTMIAPGDLWTTDLPDGAVVVPSVNAMKIFGEVHADDPNDTLVTTAKVYAFSQEKLFVVTDASADDGVENDPNRGYFHIDPINAYGGAPVLEDGSYHIIVYGQESISGTATPGFKYGEAVILVVDLNPDGDADYKIATTACLANADYAIAFDGGPTKYPVEHNIYLSQREEINLQEGWNLISTSISGAYVNSALMASRGLDPDDYSRYLYASDDILAGEGSLPTVDEVYELKNISSVLFTLSNKFFTGNIFYDPATNPIFPVEDQLADNFNKTPVFCTGRGYYIYIKKVPLPAGAAGPEWKIVLFGNKVSSPEYKLKIDNTYDLIGHWGNLAYRTYDGTTMLNVVRPLLPSTHDKTVTAEIVEDIAASQFIEDVVFMVCDVNGDPVDMNVVSTFWNYNATYNYPASWYSVMPDFSNLFAVTPGVGYWILLDADASDGPFFVSYAPKDVQ